jgi:UDP-N-acetylglucosamine 3-dehydrogenase
MKNPHTVRVGVIGLGQIALKAHLPGFSKVPGCRLTAVQSSRQVHARQTAQQFGIPHVHKDWRKLLGSDQVDAVSITTPNATHFPIALKALREGKHVLVEKPMTVTTQEAKTLIAAAAKAKRVLMVHHNMRFDPAVRTAEKLLRRGTIGEVLAFKCSLTHRGPKAWNPKADWFFDMKRSGGGALMDLGPHVFDSLAFLLGDPASLVGAAAVLGPAGRKGSSSDPETHCACLLRFRRGTIGTVNLGWADTAYQNRFYFFGSKGTLSLNLAKGDPITIQFRGKDGKEFPALDPDSFAPSLYEHFVDCARIGKTPSVPGEAGLRTLELIEEGYRSIRAKRVVPI